MSGAEFRAASLSTSFASGSDHRTVTTPNRHTPHHLTTPHQTSPHSNPTAPRRILPHSTPLLLPVTVTRSRLLTTLPYSFLVTSSNSHQARSSQYGARISLHAGSKRSADTGAGSSPLGSSRVATDPASPSRCSPLSRRPAALGRLVSTPITSPSDRRAINRAGLGSKRLSNPLPLLCRPAALSNPSKAPNLDCGNPRSARTLSLANTSVCATTV